jgi:protein TonB
VSKRLGESGTAHLYVRVSEAGCVTETIMTSSTGYARLDAAALDLVTRARFKPAEIGGHAVASGLAFKFAFNLTD